MATLICEECGRLSGPEALAWHGYLIDLNEDGEAEVGFFCPACVDREFLPTSDEEGR